VDVGAAFVADEESFELVEVGEGALDDPAHPAEPAAMLGLATRDHRLDALLADEPAVLVVVVAAVCDDGVGAFARPSNAAVNRRDAVEQRDQLGDVVAVAARDSPGERDPAGVDEDVVLRAFAAAVDRARARFGAPFFACT